MAVAGRKLRHQLEAAGYEITETVIVPDDEDRIYSELIRLTKSADLVITSGGTGLSERDHTPEATLKAGKKNVPGIAEAIRYNSLLITPEIKFYFIFSQANFIII